ncbi:MAG: hypothetical protein ACRCZP_09175, partial [Phycicoccus sp.]
KVHTPPRREEPAEPRTEQPSAGGVVKCTETGRPIADCDCGYSRHVATADGAKRYGLSVGAPMGRRKKTGRESATRKAS